MSLLALPVHVVALFAAVLAVPLSAVPPEPAGKGAATRMSIAGADVEGVEAVADESTPPRFTLVVERQMPTPGFRWQVDSVEVDPSERRIVARVTEVAPEGIVAQVLTRTRFEVPIGAVDVGPYFVELWSRRDAARDHRPAIAWVVEAR